jgi:hypothetical protein
VLYTLIIEMVNTLITEMKKKVGRPPGKTQDRPFQMKVNDAFIATIDDWRRRRPDFPSRAEAIRRLIDSHPEIRALAAESPPDKPPKKKKGGA